MNISEIFGVIVCLTELLSEMMRKEYELLRKEWKRKQTKNEKRNIDENKNKS